MLAQKRVRNARADWFSCQRKAEILRLWRISQKRVLTDGITQHEIKQWDVLESTYGKEGLQLRHEDMTKLRVTTLPPLPFCHSFRESGYVKEIRDVMGFIITEPSTVTPRERLLYLTVKALTELVGICTYPDLYQTLWPLKLKKLPSEKIIDVYVSNINKKIAPDTIKNLTGRGHIFSSST